MEEIQIIINTRNGETEFRVLDLIGDQWRDFHHYYQESARCEQHKDFVGANRAKRSALVCLWSHVDGIVQAIYSKHKIELDPFVHRDEKGRCSLKRLILGIINHARTARGLRLPLVDLESKPLRDIVNHPTKLLASGKIKIVNHGRKITISDIFDLPIKELKQSSQSLDRWLKATCKLYEFERFADTEKIFAELADMFLVKKYTDSVKI